jgi:hypothetical protein
LTACAWPRRQALGYAPDVAAVRSVPGVHLLDNTSIFCDRTLCHQIVGRILAYRDDNHLTNEIVDSMRPRLAKAIDAALPSGR